MLRNRYEGRLMRAIAVTGDLAGRCATILMAVAVATGLGACGGGSKGAATVGVGVGVALSAPSGTTLIAQGGTLEIDAAVSNDQNNAGVTWTLAGPGSASSSTTTAYVYLAPTGISGALTVTLTASSITDPTRSASVTITVNGTPIIVQPVLFPANLNIAYGAYIGVAGGLAPYTWSVSSGTLPAGLALNGSTAATLGITGTPTALGSSTFTITVKDANSATASVVLTVTVNPQTACLLLGRYAYLFTGFRDGLPVVRAGSVNVASDGTLTGIHDYKDAYGARVAEPVTNGTCKTVSQNRGTLQLVSATRVESFDYAVTSALASGHLQEDDGSPVVGSGQFFQQQTTAFPQALVAGDYAFGVIGDSGSKQRLGMIGRLTVDAAGAVSNGQADTNAAPPLVAGTLTGTLTAADANGRGTATLTVGSQSMPLAYYVVDANTVYLVSADASATTARVAGRMTRQTGAGTLDATALAGPAVLSLWGSSIVQTLPAATVTAGLLSGGAGGTVPVEIDVADRGMSLAHLAYAAAPYTVAANGRGTLTLGSDSSARSFVLYLAGAGSGYLLEPSSAVGNFGIVDQQIGAPFADFPGTNYIGGSVFPTSTSPITMTPQILLQDGAISGNVTGSYAIDPTTGRIIATLSRNILGGSGVVGYLVSPQKIVVIGDGVNSVNSALAWLQKY
jgi:hypothetical protein